jgi:hypothetical protein
VVEGQNVRNTRNHPQYKKPKTKVVIYCLKALINLYL